MYRLALIAVLIAIVFVVGAVSMRAQPNPCPSSHTLYVEPGLSIQQAIDQAANCGAGGGMSENSGQTVAPWLVLVHPGDYEGFATRNGVDVAGMAPRSVLTGPVVCQSNTTLTNLTIEARDFMEQPALTVTEGAIQCSVHNSILVGAWSDSGYYRQHRAVAVKQTGGFLRVFDSDIRSGRVILSPTVNWPAGNPVGMNFIRSRAWNGDFYIEGPNNALLMLQSSVLEGNALHNTSTAKIVYVKLSGNVGLGAGWTR